MGFGRCSADIKKGGSPLGQKVTRGTAGGGGGGGWGGDGRWRGGGLGGGFVDVCVCVCVYVCMCVCVFTRPLRLPPPTQPYPKIYSITLAPFPTAASAQAISRFGV